MLDGYHILTLTHRQVALQTIGQAMVRDDAAHDPAVALSALQARFGWEELYYLATCNRVMYLFYTSAALPENLNREVLAFLRPELPDAAVEMLAGELSLLHGHHAVQHLLEVAASMDSLVVGEREIIRQLREAYDRSKGWGLTGDHLRLLMRFTVETAKEIYSSTGIGEKAVSIVALAFNRLLQTGLSPDARILMVGAGQTNALMTKFLAKYGFHNVTIFNRTLEKAEALALPLGGRALPLDALEHYTGGFDALIVCTGSTQAVITPALYHRLLAAEATVKVVVDLAIPNNVDPRVPDIFPVRYIEIEGLREAASINLAHRERERVKAEALIALRIRDFRQLWHERQVERSLAHIPQEVRAIKERAVREVFGKEFGQLDPQAQQVMLKMLDYMEKKCVAIPMKAAKAIVLHAAQKHQPAGHQVQQDS
jgi:glutamyl-tRNA reductase